MLVACIWLLQRCIYCVLLPNNQLHICSLNSLAAFSLWKFSFRKSGEAVGLLTSSWLLVFTALSKRQIFVPMCKYNLPHHGAFGWILTMICLRRLLQHKIWFGTKIRHFKFGVYLSRNEKLCSIGLYCVFSYVNSSYILVIFFLQMNLFFYP